MSIERALVPALLAGLVAASVQAAYYTHSFVLRNRRHRPLQLVATRLARDGTLATAPDTTISYEDVYSGDDGRVEQVLPRKRAYKLEVTLPLLDKPVTLTVSPSAREVVVPGVDVVQCSFRCGDGKRAGFAGYTAVALMKDGSVRRFEWPVSDVLRGHDVALAWPRGARELQVHAPGFVQAVLHDPRQHCVLKTLPQRTCL